jgi:hypothetical protein
MSTAIEIAFALVAMLAVYALCRRDWPTAAASVTGALILALFAIMNGGDEHRDY